ncbi:hypothetical protein M0M42_01560 [Pseudomonas knackmussii]|uniref:Secreted protein n=1 Tax=Pseudomonas knackmussii TaxID=65741 RepID=A0ABY4KTT0_9PSED|nr:hypothetical protein [Pseudomonas knackmussii]UPQ83128.1 hypothetical protein M0M42_01560 [Pseudomonas knackmussii]
MSMRLPLLIASLALVSSAFATGTGPTMPEKTREHPLDNREPRQEVIDRQGDSQRQPRPPTLESPPEIAPIEPVERRPESDRPEGRDSGTGGS